MRHTRSARAILSSTFSMAHTTTTDQTGTILVDSDGDSTFGDNDSASETTSLRSAVLNYVYENGRRYHSYRAGAYW
jgi:hypothetical protein